MKCAACKFDDENARDEDGFWPLKTRGAVEAVIPQHEASAVEEPIILFVCPKCGTVRIEQHWRLGD